MSKEFNLGKLKITIPEHQRDVGQAMELLQNQHEQGNLTAMFVVFATKETIGSALVGNSMVIPFTCMAANVLSSQVLDNIESSFSTHEED